MSNIRNMNQANDHAFWDMIASLQNGFQNHPGQFTFGGPPGLNGESDPFDGQHWGQQFGPMPHRGRRHGPPGHRGPPPPPPPPPEEGDEAFGPSGAPSSASEEGKRSAPPPGPPPPGPHGHPHGHPRGRHVKGPRESHGHYARGPPPPPELEGILPPSFQEESTSRPGTPPTPPETPAEPHHHPHAHGHPRGHHHGGSRGQYHGPSLHGPPHHHRGPPSPHRRGGRFGGRGGPYGPHGGRHGGPRHGGPGGFGGPTFPFDLSALAEAFAPGMFGNSSNSSSSNKNNNTTTARNGDDGTFTPEVDVFDTESAYIIHASVPGAKKPDLDISYTAARNSVTISGVITRPNVDEEMMSALALDERKIGSFEREIRLDEKVKIEEDQISAKLEDGVLRVTVPKVVEESDEEDYIEVRKVELE